MRRTLPVITAVAAVLLSAACGTSVKAATAPTTTTTTITSSPAATSPAAAPSTDIAQGTSPGGTDPDSLPAGDGAVDGDQLGVTPGNGRAGIGQPITYSNGVQVTVDHARRATATESATAEQGAPLIAFDVTIKNGSKELLTGSDVMVVVLAGQTVAEPVADVSLGWRGEFAGVISPGRSVRVTYAAQASAQAAKDIEVQVSPDGGMAYPMGLFAGAAS